MNTMLASDLPLPRIGRGKVRDIYAVGDDRVLLLTTDRISAFDVVMAETIPMKGAVLTQISAWWFRAARRYRAASHDQRRRRRDHRAGAGAAGPSRLARRARDAVQAHHGVSDRMRDPRLYLGLGVEANMPRSGTLAGEKLPPGPAARAASSSRRSSARRPRPRAATTRTSRSARMREILGEEVTHTLESMTRVVYTLGETDQPRARHHHRRHQVRIRPRRTTAASS